VHYIYGREIVVDTDHKSLGHIFKNRVVNVPVRLSRMLKILQQFQVKFVYTPGTEMFFVQDYFVFSPLVCCCAPGSSDSLSVNRAIADVVQENKYGLRQTYWFKGGVENIPLVLVNMHCSARTHCGSHIAALLGKPWICFPEYVLQVHVMYEDFFYTLCLSSYSMSSG
jgi:hypothetical protein